MKPEQSTVYIVDDDRAFRESLLFLIESAGFAARGFDSALRFLQECDPAARGSMLLDIRMPEMTGLELLAALPQRGIKLPVIMITGHGDVPMAVRAIKAGAFDFYEKPFNDASLLACVRRAIALDSDRHGKVLHQSAIQSRINLLTPRERQVLEGVIEGRLNKQIAEDLKLSEKTVESHRSNLMKKMQAQNVVHLVKLVLESNPLATAAADQ
ncbi:MAG: response regulator [Phycisphaeraceae bacterium]